MLVLCWLWKISPPILWFAYFPHSPVPGNHHSPLCFYELSFFRLTSYISEIIQYLSFSI